MIVKIVRMVEKAILEDIRFNRFVECKWTRRVNLCYFIIWRAVIRDSS